MQRVEIESVDELSDNAMDEQRASMPDNFPDKFGDIAGQLQVLEEEQAAEMANTDVDGLAVSAGAGSRAISQISIS